MAKKGEDWRPDFEQAVGETFGEFVSPPVPFEDASPHECCEVVWAVAGRRVTPARPWANVLSADVGRGYMPALLARSEELNG